VTLNIHFADRLLSAIRRTNAPVCVGLDPVLDRLPKDLLADCGVQLSANGTVDPQTKPAAVAEALLAFGNAVIERVADHVPALKINIAFFEPHYAEGIRVYFELVRRAQRAGLLVIGDVKRSDIGHSCEQYAAAHLGQEVNLVMHDVAVPDAITVNPLLGLDGVQPFADVAREKGKGVFLLVQTSNPSASEIQGLKLAEGITLSERLAQIVHRWATQDRLVGSCGYSSIGAVVAPTDPVITARLRTLMPQCLFLVPGFGAQGRSAEEVALCFKPDGTGAIVNASRNVIFAFADPRRQRHGNDWRTCIEEGCKEFVTAIRAVRSS